MAVQVVPPPFRITAHDKSGLIVVTVAVTLCFVWSCFFIRLWLRSQAREWKPDDWWLTIATLLQTAQSALVFHGVQSGLGALANHASFSTREDLGREGLASQIIYVCTLFASKCSVLFLYLRISSGGSHKAISWSILGASLVWLIVAITLISVPCNLVGWTTAPETCTNMWPKWQAISAIDIATEVCIFAIAVRLVWSINMRMTSKLLVVLAFSARLPVIVVAAVRLYYVKRTFVHHDSTYVYLVATQWQMGYATMSSTITGMGPFLRPFYKEYISSFYHKSTYAPHGSSPDPVSRCRSTNSWTSQSYPLNPLHPSQSNGVMDPIGSPAHNLHTLPSTSNSFQHAPLSQSAVETFRPADEMLACGTEIWVGSRTSRDEEDLEAMTDEARLVITKRTELKVETDQAS